MRGRGPSTEEKERAASPAGDAAPAVTGNSGMRGFLLEHFAVLADRNCLVFFIGYTVSLTGSSMVPVALSFAVLKQGHGSGAVGAVLAAETLPLAVLLLLGGILADRLPRRAMMFTADVLRLASEAVLALLLITGHPSVLLMMGLAAILGSGQAFFNPALTGFVPQIASEERLQDANSLFGLSKAVARVGGPGIAGVLIATAGPGIAIAVDAATYAVSLICLILVHPRPSDRQHPDPLLGQLIEGWQAFRSRRWLWVTVAQGGLSQLFTFSPFLVIGASLFNKHGGSAAWGALLAADGLGGLLGALFAMRMRPQRPLVVAVGASLALALTPLLIAFDVPLPVVLVGSFVSGVGVAGFISLFDTVLQRNIPEGLLSRVSAYNWLCTIALSPLGYAVAGPASSQFGPRNVLLFGAIWAVVSGLAVLLVREVRALRWVGE
jgi:MFS family permease